jgi:ubiquinone/menaquinone biosynthesis C-methylase UbiE
VYSIPNIIGEIKHRMLTLIANKTSEESALVNENKEVSIPKSLDIPLHTTTQVGAFYNEFNDKFLQVYGDVIQAFRTQDVSILLDYQIEALQLKEGMKVLDAGCGVCGPAIYFAEKTGVSVNAITISEEQVNRAEEKIKNKQLQEKVTVKKGDYHNIKSVFPDVEYDVVYFLESFGHSPYHEKALDSAWEVLKPGGLLYIKDLFKRLPLLPEHEPKIEREIKKINEAYRYNVADLNTILDCVRKKGWIVAAVKTIDLKMEEFENLMISNEFQELTGIAKIENWDDYIFPIDFFELFLYKPQFDLQFGLDKYFLQNLMYMQVHSKKQEEL